MKKSKSQGLISLCIIVVLTLALVICSDGIYGALSSIGKSHDATVAQTADNSTADTASAVKTGLGIVIDLTSSSSATADSDGVGESDAMIAAVTVDASGRITACEIDCAQIKINFSNAGVITSDASASYPTKQEKGYDYGMKAYAGAALEWFEQADAFADYCVGKTAAEIEGITITNGYIDDSVDLKASVTVHASDFKSAVLKAVNNALGDDTNQCSGASSTDKLGLAVVTNISSSADAAADSDGQTQAYSTIAAVTLDAQGNITSCVIDAYQAKVFFDTTGTITSDLSAGTQTKNELKENYGMKAYAGSTYEWYEQAQNFASYCVGKNAAGIDGIAIESGHVTDADLLAGVTIGATDFKDVVAKAVVNAQ